MASRPLGTPVPMGTLRPPCVSQGPGCGERQRWLRRTQGPAEVPTLGFRDLGGEPGDPPPHQPVHGGAGEGLGVSPSTPSPQVALAVLVGWPRG